MADCELLLGKAYGRFFFQSFQVCACLPAVPESRAQPSSQYSCWLGKELLGMPAGKAGST